jgi:hypothetical protein
MRPWVRGAVVAGAFAAVAVLFVVLSPAATQNADDSPTPSATGSPSTPESPSPTPSPAPEVTVIEVVVRDGNVEGPGRPTARLGDNVRIVVRADVSDHVHLHGYDLMADVAPGRPATIELVADAAGVFEVELEDAGRLLFRLEIVP